MYFEDIGKLPTSDNSEINETTFEQFKKILNYSIRGGTLI